MLHVTLLIENDDFCDAVDQRLEKAADNESSVRCSEAEVRAETER